MGLLIIPGFIGRDNTLKAQWCIGVLGGLMLLVDSCGRSVVEKTSGEEPLQTGKIYEVKQAEALRSLYTGDSGLPSRDEFLKANGLFPRDMKVEVVPYFTAGYAVEEMEMKNGKLVPSKEARPLNIDFFVEISKEYHAAAFLKPIGDGRAYEDKNRIMIGAYSSQYNEIPVAEVTGKGEITLLELQYDEREFPLLAIPLQNIVFDPFSWTLGEMVLTGGKAIEEKTRQYLPLKIFSKQGRPFPDNRFTVEILKDRSGLSLTGTFNGKIMKLAGCKFAEARIIDQRTAFRPALIEGCTQPGKGEVITVRYRGEFTELISLDQDLIYLQDESVSPEAREVNDISGLDEIVIDGDFSDWRNVSGITDARGDHVSYLYPNPDTDILEFKVANDEKYLYFYSRVTGAHGRSGEKGRYYWYTYIDVDQDPHTGYPPTRDDNCYFGIPIGDDSEAQFEFVGNRFVKTFFGFTGAGKEEEMLTGNLPLGPSFYSSVDQDGHKRDRYKVEYVHREGSRSVTHDYTDGTSEDIVMALSPDASEVEVRVEMSGFLQDEEGNRLIQRGKKINIAVGAEASSDYYKSEDWGADSSPVIYGYLIK